MARLLLFILFTLSIVSCSEVNSANSHQEPLTEKENEKTIPIEPIEPIEVVAMLDSEIKWAEDSISNFKFIGKDLCGQDRAEGPNRFLSIDTLRKYGRHKPYYLQKSEIHDSIIMSFSMIGDCCLSPSKRIRINTDSLWVIPRLSGNEPCDCTCDYFFEYRFPKSAYESYWIGM
jgi:hypothetical protein